MKVNPNAFGLTVFAALDEHAKAGYPFPHTLVLTPRMMEVRAWFHKDTCERLGLDPASHPIPEIFGIPNVVEGKHLTLIA